MGGIPFVPGLYDYRPGERIADLIMRSGDVAAARQARSGEIWGGAVNQLGQIASEAIKKHQEDEDQKQVGGAISAATSKQYPSATQPGPVGSGAPIDPGSYQGPPGMTADMSGRVQDPGEDHVATILNRIDPKLRPSVMKGIQDFNAAQDVADERQARLLQMHQAAQQASADAAATLAHGLIIHKASDGPDGGLSWYVNAANVAKQKGAPWASAWDKELGQAQSAMQQAQAIPDPDRRTQAIAAVADTVRQHFGPLVQQLEMSASQALQDKWRVDEKLIDHNPEHDLLSPDGLTVIKPGVPKAPNLELKETDKGLQPFNPKTAELGPVIAKGKTPAAMVQIGPGLTDAGLDAAALRYAKDGTLPPIGRGGQGAAQRDKVINRAAEMFPGLDIASNKATLGADTSSLKKLQPQVDAVTAFERTAKANSAVLQDAMKRIPDLGSKFLNRPWRSLKDNLGSEDMAKFNTIRQSVQNEYARIISNPGLSGTMSDSARKEAEMLLSDSATVGQIKKALETLQQEAENRRLSYEQQITDIKGRLKGGSAPATADPLGLR